jgi:hypothetical protein
MGVRLAGGVDRDIAERIEAELEWMRHVSYGMVSQRQRSRRAKNVNTGLSVALRISPGAGA